MLFKNACDAALRNALHGRLCQHLLLLSWLAAVSPRGRSSREEKAQSANMFKKRTLKGQKKATGPTVDAPAEDTSDALDDVWFA